MGFSLKIVMDDLYSKLDAKAAEAIAKTAAAGKPVSCVEGCSACCSLLTTITQTEAYRIALHLQEEGKVTLALIDRLAQAARDTPPEASNADHFQKNMPCVFLENNRCTIYAVRPAPCRFHYVVSPAADCAPTAPREKGVFLLNLLHLEEKVWDFDLRVRAAMYKHPVELGAVPIPLGVLSMLDGQEAEAARAALPYSPEEWMIRHVEGAPPSREEFATMMQALGITLPK